MNSKTLDCSSRRSLGSLMGGLLVVWLTAACTQHHEETCLWPAIAHLIEDSLEVGHTQAAQQLTRQWLTSATDSDAYYMATVSLAKCYFEQMQTDSFLDCNQRLGGYLKRQQSHLTPCQEQLLVEWYMQQGVYQAKMVGHMDSAQQCNLMALHLMEGHPQQAAQRLVVLANIADTYKLMGRYDLSVEHYKEAMQLGDSIDMDKGMRLTLIMGIASAYAAMGSFDQSATWWEQAAQMRDSMPPNDLFFYLNNRGNDYYLQACYEQSLTCFLELDSLLRQRPQMVWERMVAHANLSDIYIKLEQPAKARPLLEEAEAFFLQEQQTVPLYYLTTQRIELLLAEGHTAAALRLARESTTPLHMIPEQLMLRQKVLMKLYLKVGDWEHYAHTLQDYTTLQDTIANDQMKMRFSETLMDYEHEKLIMEKQRQIEAKEQSVRLSTALLVVALLAIVLLIMFIAQKRRERRLRDMEVRSHIASLRMETVRNRITPHFIGNALAAEMMAQMDGKEVNLNELVQLLHRGIEMTGTEQTTLSEELEFIRYYCSIERCSVGDDFRLDIRLAPDVKPDQVLLPSMMVQIMVENAIKHGLKALPRQEGRWREVIVSATRYDGATLIEVTDNGVGLAQNSPVCEHTGLRVIRQTISVLNEQNTGQMVFAIKDRREEEHTQGTKSSLWLPDDFTYTLKTKRENGK